jgi:hypothetical protein
MFNVFIGTTLVGHTALDFEDPYPFCAMGFLVPLPSYAAFQDECIATQYTSQSHLSISIERSDGERLPSGIPVAIMDGSRKSKSSLNIELHVIGNDSSDYSLIRNFVR